MTTSVSLRTPLVPLNDPANGQINIVDSFTSDGALQLTYIGDEAEGLRLNPFFPGQLSFRPADGITIPLDPLADGAAPISGHLLLTLSTFRQRALRREESSFNYPLVLIYHHVSLDRAFFQGTILHELAHPSGSGFKTVRRDNGQQLQGEAEICHAFAAGDLDVLLYGRKTHVFPLMPAGSAPNERRITLTLGVPISFNPYRKPHRPNTITQAELFDPIRFVSLPLSFLIERLRQLPTWSEIVHADFASHPFWTAVEAASPSYRRLRLFLPGDRPATSQPVKAFPQLTLQALDIDGSEAWNRMVNPLAELFLEPDEIQGRDLAVEWAGTPINLAATTDGSGAQPVFPWPSANTTQLDLTLMLDLRGDPLTLSPQVPLYRGLKDIRGLTIDTKAKTIVAEQELVAPLQEELDNFGWPVSPFGLFGRRTRRNVKAFQAQAKTSRRLDDQGMVDPATVTPWGGEVTGRADADTLAEMLVWRQNDYRSAESDKLWALTHSWAEQVGSSGKTYAQHYHDWLAQNLDRFNNRKLLCNWFPIKLLIEYAAAHGLRVKLRYWTPKDNPAKGPIHTHDSHGGDFNSKSQYYRRTRRTVTSRMIGELNTVSLPEAERKIGDFIVIERRSFTWHTYVVTDLLGGSKCLVQYGNQNPAEIPKENETEFKGLTEMGSEKPYGGNYRRWDFAAFD